MKYYKRHWDESRGDEYDAWGESDWWFEVGEKGSVVRCLQVYSNGISLYYSETHKEDKYGKLPEGPIDVVEFSDYSVKKEQFELSLAQSKPKNMDRI